MNITPGSNLLKQALKVIKKNKFVYLQFKSRSTNDIGIDIPVYAPGVECTGSVQYVSRSLYQTYGLDFKKSYIMIYSSDELKGVDVDTSGDRVIFNDEKYQILDENDWLFLDGWNGVMCVKVADD